MDVELDHVGKSPGWHLDPDTGVWMRAVIHSMTRRCYNWDYCGTGTYLITLVLNDRSRSVLGWLDESKPTIVLSELGRAVEAHFRRIPAFTPEIEVLGVQVMPRASARGGAGCGFGMRAHSVASRS